MAARLKLRPRRFLRRRLTGLELRPRRLTDGLPPTAYRTEAATPTAYRADGLPRPDGLPDPHAADAALLDASQQVREH